MATAVSISIERCWLVRSLSKLSGRKTITSYYVSPQCWDLSPRHATIFPSEADAQSHVKLCASLRPPNGWGDGSTEIFDAVPMHGAILNYWSWRSIRLTLCDLSDGKRYINEVVVQR